MPITRACWSSRRVDAGGRLPRALRWLLVCVALVSGVARAGDPMDAVEVVVVSHGYHSGLAIPHPGAGNGGPWATVYPDYRWLEIGWGDAGFYQDPDPGLLRSTSAALWPTRAVLHVVGLEHPPTEYFAGMQQVSLRLGREQYAELVNEIAGYFRVGKDAQPIGLGAGLYGTSRFYRAKGRFHLMRNCNHWAAARLRAAGVKARARYPYTGDALVEYLRDKAVEAR